MRSADEVALQCRCRIVERHREENFAQLGRAGLQVLLDLLDGVLLIQLPQQVLLIRRYGCDKYSWCDFHNFTEASFAFKCERAGEPPLHNFELPFYQGSFVEKAFQLIKTVVDLHREDHSNCYRKEERLESFEC